MFKRLMLATDFSVPAMMAATAAQQIAKAFDAAVTLTHVAPPTGLTEEEGAEALAVLHEAQFHSLSQVERLLLHAERAPYAICDAAKKRAVDLIVAGRHGEHGLAERLIGTTTERIARHAPCSVYVSHPARQDQPVMLKHIVAACDFSGNAQPALIAAANMARQFGAYVSLVHVFDLLPGVELLQEPYALHPDTTFTAMLTDKLEEQRKQHFEGLPAEVRVLRHKSTVTALCDLASDVEADLIIAGTHGLTGLPRFLLGSVAERLIRHAPCSVLVVR